MSGRMIARILSWLVAAPLFWCVPTMTAAQFQPINPNPPRSRFIEPPRAIQQAINDAEKAAAAGRFADAVVTLGDLLAREAVVQEDADLAGQDFFLSAAGDNQSNRSLMREAESALGRLPAQALEIYESRFGAKARQVVEQATAQRDRRALREASRRYFHTSAGYDATFLLGALELQEGHPVAALAALRRLASQSQARERFGKPLMLRLAQAEFLAGQPTAAAEHALAATRDGLPAGIQLADTSLPDANNVMDWMEKNFGQLSYHRPSPTDATWVHGGGAARYGVAGGDVPLSRIRWDVLTTNSQQQQRSLLSFAADTLNGTPPPPSWQPIVVGNQLLMRTTERMVAVDFETGKLIWEYPWATTADAANETLVEVDRLGNAEAARELLVQRVWNDLPYGRISSDGKRVYMLNDLAEVEVNSAAGMGLIAIQSVRPSSGGTNTLVALDLASEGKLVWTRGRNGNEPRAEGLGDAFFLGPPLPVEGLLYQLAEIAGDTYLLCMQPETGKELWRQQLLGNEGGSVLVDPMRRISGAVPAYSDGILVCPTGAGAVVAMDLASRNLLWGTYLPTADINAAMRGNARFRPNPDQTAFMNRWLDGTPIVLDGCVLITPVESDRLFGFDLLTGEPLWAPLPRKDFRYLAGARDGQFLLVANDRVEAFDLRTGQPRWNVPCQLENTESAAGTGAFGDHVYLLPTTANAVVEIDLDKGVIARRRNLQFSPGNLLVFNGNLISQDATKLSVAYLEAPLRSLVENRVQGEQLDQWSMIRQGELLLQDGEYQKAVDWLMRARSASTGEDEETRVLLVDSMLELIRSGQVPDPETMALLDQLILFPQQRVELLRLKVERSNSDGNGLAGIQSLVELSQILLQEEQLLRPKQAKFFSTGGDSRAAIDAWIAAKFDALLTTLDVAQRTDAERIVSSHLQSLIAEAPTVQRRGCNQFGRSAASDLLRQGLFTSAFDDGSWGIAERLALDAIEFAKLDADHARQGIWLAKLSDVYMTATFMGDALIALQQSESLGTPVVAERMELLRQATLPPAWPQGVRLTVRDDTMQARMQQTRPAPADIVGRRGISRAFMQPYTDRAENLFVRNGFGFDHLIQYDAGRTNNDLVQATIDGGLMILLTNQELVAIDLLVLESRPVDAILWRRPWRSQSGNQSVSSRGSQEFFDDNRKTYIVRTLDGGGEQSGVVRLGPLQGRKLFYLQGKDLIAVDVIANEELWRVSGFSGDAYVVAEGDQVAVCSSQLGTKVFRQQDGSFVRQSAWDPGEAIYMASGSHLLTAQDEPVSNTTQVPNRRLRLRAPISERELLSTTIASEPNERKVRAFARILGGRHMVLVHATGKLVIWDLWDGKSISDTQIEVGGQLSGIQAAPWKDCFVIALVRRGDRNLENANQLQIDFQDGPEHVETDGPLVCVNATDGAVRWTYSLDSPWGISLHQASESPLLILTRSKRQYIGNGKPNRTLDMTAIDVRTGKLAAAVDGMRIESNFTSIGTETRVAPESAMVDVTARRYGFSFQFVDEEIPPEERVLNADAVAKQIAEAGTQGILDIRAPGLLPLEDGR